MFDDAVCLSMVSADVVVVTQLVQSDTLRYDHFCFKPSSKILKYHIFYQFNPLNVKYYLIVN